MSTVGASSTRGVSDPREGVSNVPPSSSTARGSGFSAEDASSIAADEVFSGALASSRLTATSAADLTAAAAAVAVVVAAPPPKPSLLQLTLGKLQALSTSLPLPSPLRLREEA